VVALPTIEELLRSCARTALHLETRDGYDRTDPMFIAWQAGDRDDPADRESWWRPWLDLIVETTRRGVAVRRARIVSEPVSEYIRFEYDGTFTNVAAGEDVRWLPRHRATDLALPGNDFWLFDDGLVRVGHFSGDGQSTGHEMITDPLVIKLCASSFDGVWERAIPHERYRPI